jgi:hypothetical protein
MVWFMLFFSFWYTRNRAYDFYVSFISDEIVGVAIIEFASLVGATDKVFTILTRRVSNKVSIPFFGFYTPTPQFSFGGWEEHINMFW